MSSVNVVILCSGNLGLKVTEFLCNQTGVKIHAVFLPDAKVSRETFSKLDLNLDTIKVLPGIGWTNFVESGLEGLMPNSYLVSAYWPWKIPSVIINRFKETINFHPSLLPENRGWYPHVHNILFGSQPGVTLHRIDDSLDTGPIWAQRKITLMPHETAGILRARLDDEIFSLFTDIWQGLISGSLSPMTQPTEGGNFLQKGWVDEYDLIDLEQLSAAGLYKRLLARSHDDRGFSYVEENGKRFYLQLRVSNSP